MTVNDSMSVWLEYLICFVDSTVAGLGVASEIGCFDIPRQQLDSTIDDLDWSRITDWKHRDITEIYFSDTRRHLKSVGVLDRASACLVHWTSLSAVGFKFDCNDLTTSVRFNDARTR